MFKRNDEKSWKFRSLYVCDVLLIYFNGRFTIHRGLRSMTENWKYEYFVFFEREKTRSAFSLFITIPPEMTILNVFENILRTILIRYFP